MREIEEMCAISAGDYSFKVNNMRGFLQNMSIIMPLINALPNATFFVKNSTASYQLANDALVKRCRLNRVDELIGKRAEQVFNADIGMGYTQQDCDVIKSKRRIDNQLELHFYKSGALGWCLTTKIPIVDNQDVVLGIVGISIDLQDDKLIRPKLNDKLGKVEKYISLRFHESIKICDMADMIGMSISQLDRQFKSIFHMTPQQYVQKKRLEHAIYLLATDVSITDIASKCGYTDHSAFSRKFKELTTLSPSEFKKKFI